MHLLFEKNELPEQAPTKTQLRVLSIDLQLRAWAHRQSAYAQLSPLYPSLYLYVTHVINYPRPSTAFPYCKWRKAGRRLGMRLLKYTWQQSDVAVSLISTFLRLSSCTWRFSKFLLCLCSVHRIWDCLFRSEDTEKKKGVLLAWATVPCFLWKIWKTRLLRLKVIT